MPRKFDRDKIGLALATLMHELGRVKVRDLPSDPVGEAKDSLHASQTIPPSNGVQLMDVTAMPTKGGEDELLTITLLAT